jgi:hypothetical protein
MMICLPVAFTIGVMVGALRSDPSVVLTVILTTVAAWIGVEAVLYVSLNLISLFGWSGEQWVALYNAWRPLVPSYVSRYAAKRQARKDRKDKQNAG